jgi:large subunit ribosomal protein L4e
MFAPLKVWRRWHRRVNIKQKRHAAASALAASGIVPLVFARGHRISQVPQVPLVIEDKLESIEKTKDAVKFLKKIGAFEDVEKVVSTRSMRAGMGKARGKRFRVRKGPLIVYFHENAKLTKAFRNVPGVEVANVNRLNLLQLAPGG